MKDVNIVLVNYLMKDSVLVAVDSVFRDISGCSYDFAITVVDNSKNADYIREALAEKFPQARYIDAGGNVGFGQGTSVGFKAVPARYYFALNPDTIIPDNGKAVERMVKFMDDNPKIGCIGPKVLNTDRTLQYSCYRFDLPSILIKPLKHINFDQKYKWVKKYADRLAMKDFDHNETRPVDWILAAALMVRSEVVEKIGWFDERYFMYMEDCDWCRRMWENGWPVYYFHEVSVLHTHNRDSAKVPGLIKGVLKNKSARMHGASWLKYLWKWKGNNKFYRY